MYVIIVLHPLVCLVYMYLVMSMTFERLHCSSAPPVSQGSYTYVSMYIRYGESRIVCLSTIPCVKDRMPVYDTVSQGSYTYIRYGEPWIVHLKMY